MKRLGGKPIDMKRCICPQCNKPRMTRPLDHVVSQETKKVKNRLSEEIELLVDICDTCISRNYRDHFEPQRLDLKKIMSAVKENQQLPTEQSLEELL